MGKQEAFGSWNLLSNKRVGDHGHTAVVWYSTRRGWCAENRYYNISIKNCKDAHAARCALDEALREAGCLLCEDVVKPGPESP